jgi:hypothetical protein
MLGIERQRLHQLNSAPTTPVSKLSLAARRFKNAFVMDQRDHSIVYNSFPSSVTQLNFAVISDGVKSNDFSIE